MLHWVCQCFWVDQGLLSHTLALQLEDIAIDPHAEDGKGSIGSTQALNMDFTQTQATQGISAPKVTWASDPVLSTCIHALILGRCKCFASSASFLTTIIQQHRHRPRV